MKKNKIILFITILLFCWIMPVSATTSVSIKTDSPKVLLGEKIKLTISIQDATSWSFLTESDKTIKGCLIENEGASENGELVSKSFEYECIPLEEGNIVINLKGSINNGNIIEISDSISISVSPNSNFPYSKNTSSTAILKNLMVEGYEISKVSDYEYYLTVPSQVNRITIKGETESSNSIVEGLGEMTLKEGENIKVIKVTSEDNTYNEYKLIVIKEKSTEKSDNKPNKDSINNTDIKDNNEFKYVFIIFFATLFIIFIYLLIERIIKKIKTRSNV